MVGCWPDCNMHRCPVCELVKVRLRAVDMTALMGFLNAAVALQVVLEVLFK